MIKQVVRQIEKQPVTWLVLGAGVLAGALVAQRLVRSPERQAQLVEGLQTGADRARDLGIELLREGRREANALQDNASELKARISLPDSHSRNQNVREAMSNHESALAAFMATLLAKGASSYFQWRSAQKARAEGAAADSSGGQCSDTLETMTVVELRKQAADREIEGRSSMNKDELVDALQSDNGAG